MVAPNLRYFLGFVPQFPTTSNDIFFLVIFNWKSFINFIQLLIWHLASKKISCHSKLLRKIGHLWHLRFPDIKKKLTKFPRHSFAVALLKLCYKKLYILTTTTTTTTTYWMSCYLPLLLTIVVCCPCAVVVAAGLLRRQCFIVFFSPSLLSQYFIMPLLLFFSVYPFQYCFSSHHLQYERTLELLSLLLLLLSLELPGV